MAAVLRLQPEQIPPLREAALDRLAGAMKIEDPAERARLASMVADLPADQWPADAPRAENGHAEPTVTPVAAPAPPPQPTAVPAPERAPTPALPPAPPAERPARPRGNRRLAVLGVIVAGAVLGTMLGMLIFGGGGDDDEPSRPGAAAPQTSAPASAAVEPIAPGFPGRGTARIEGSGPESRLVMSLRDLPPREEAYAVWLYNSVGDAVLVDRVVGGRLDVDETLPADPSGYKFIDVSREPIDDNPNHSGASVMRVPVSELAGPA